MKTAESLPAIEYSDALARKLGIRERRQTEDESEGNEFRFCMRQDDVRLYDVMAVASRMEKLESKYRAEHEAKDLRYRPLNLLLGEPNIEPVISR